MGPGAGVHGGEIVAQGRLRILKPAKNSLTADYLTGRRAIPIPAKRRKGSGKKLTVEGRDCEQFEECHGSNPAIDLHLHHRGQRVGQIQLHDRHALCRIGPAA